MYEVVSTLLINNVPNKRWILLNYSIQLTGVVCTVVYMRSMSQGGRGLGLAVDKFSVWWLHC